MQSGLLNGIRKTPFLHTTDVTQAQGAQGLLFITPDNDQQSAIIVHAPSPNWDNPDPVGGSPLYATNQVFSFFKSGEGTTLDHIQLRLTGGGGIGFCGGLHAALGLNQNAALQATYGQNVWVDNSNIATAVGLVITGATAHSAAMLRIQGGSSQTATGFYIDVLNSAGRHLLQHIPINSSDAYLVLANSTPANAIILDPSPVASAFGWRALISTLAAGVGGILVATATGQTANSLQVQTPTPTIVFSVAPSGLVTTTGGTATKVIASGALSTTTFTSGTGKQISTTRDVHLSVPYTGGSSAGTIAVALSPDNVTYTTLVTIARPTTTTGYTDMLSIDVPAGWWVKLTAATMTFGTATWW